MRRILSFAPALLVLVAMFATLMMAPIIVRRIGWAQAEVDIRLARAELANDDILQRISDATRRIARIVRPSIVHIEANRPSSSGSRGRSRLSSGTAWMYDELGHLVTNAHVVNEARDIRAHFSDGSEVRAELVAADDFADIAVLRVDTGRRMFPMERATGTVLEQGDRVYAFGSPFGFRFSMSEGIVSGLGRNAAGVVSARGFSNFIQTDAAVNPGNSGGPLVDTLGRVVGMNVAIATGENPSGDRDSGQSSGISFAIPLRTIESVADQLISRGEVRRGFLGVSMGDSVRVLDPRVGREVRGIRLEQIAAAGPAERAGLRVGDVVVAIDGQSTPEIGDLRAVVMATPPGRVVKVEVWRRKPAATGGEPNADGGAAQQPEGEVLLVELQLGQFPSAAMVEWSLDDYGLGLDWRRSGPGLYITFVQRESRAYLDGFRDRMQIMGVGGRDVSTIEEFHEALGEADFLRGLPVTVRVRDLTMEGDSTSELTMRATRAIRTR